MAVSSKGVAGAGISLKECQKILEQFIQQLNNFCKEEPNRSCVINE